MFGHLKSSEFIDAIDAAAGTEGIDGTETGGLTRNRARHLESCTACRQTLAVLGELYGDLGEIDPDGEAALEREVAGVDWRDFRSSVRDGLLARSVERSSRVRRWTGVAMRPAAAWGLALVLVASALTAGGVWHYQTDHRNSATGAVVEAEAPGAAGAAAAASPPLEDGFGGFSATEVDAIAWARTDLFAVLGELESNEEDLLRQLIVEAAVEDGLDDAGPTFEPAGTLRRGTLQ